MEEGKIKLARMNPEKVADEIGKFILEQILNSGRNGGIVGLSGGVDSTTTAALAKRAFNIHNLSYPDRKLELVGYMLPSHTNNIADRDDAVRVAEKLGVRYEIISIEPVVQAFRETNPASFKRVYDKGNLMSEVRAVILHGKAATENKLVLGTGNKDEDFSVAYYTLFGDGAVHLSPLGNLSKRLVKELACYLGFPEFARRTSSPGLEPGQTAFKDLGYRYETAEIVCEALQQKFGVEEIVASSQVGEYTAQDLADYEKQFGKKKFLGTQELVYDILRRNKIARAKAEIVHPPAAPVTLEYEK